MVDMAVENEDRQKLLDHLSERLESGEEAYMRAKDIAGNVELSSKQVGKFLGEHEDGEGGINVEKWSRSRSTTWRILKQHTGGSGNPTV